MTFFADSKLIFIKYKKLNATHAAKKDFKNQHKDVYLFV